MSRWWPESLHLLVSAPVVATAAGSRDEPVAAALADAAAQLDARAPARGTRVHALVGATLVRQRVLPWAESLRDDAQREALARHDMVQVHGEAARDWALVLDAPRHGCSQVVGAVDAALVDGLTGLCEARGLRLATLEPAWAVAYNLLRHALAGPRDWLVLADPSACMVLLHEQGELRQVRRIAPPGRELVGVLERLALTLGLDGPRGTVHLAGRWPDAPPAAVGWQMQRPVVEPAAGLRRWLPSSTPRERVAALLGMAPIDTLRTLRP